MIQADEFAEYEEVYPGAFYGTPRSELEPATRTEPVILDLDVKGAKRLSEAFGEDCLTIFVRPPSLAALEDRLRDRGTESTRSLQARMKRAREEMRYRNTFNVDVINHSLPDSVQATALVVMAYLMT